MTIDRIIIQELEYPEFMSWDLAEQWADGIPVFSENDPNNPEWKATPVKKLDLTADGYGIVHVKDESVNPTGTAKARPAWEMTAAHRDYGRSLIMQKQKINGSIENIHVPRFSVITAGNEGNALSHFFEKYNLPPIKMLVDITTPAEKLAKIKHADQYMVDLSEQKLTAEDIKEASNNKGGTDITSLVGIRPQIIFYDWLVHEAFNESPDEIYVPAGSHRLFENLVTWQEKNVRLYMSDGKADQRLYIPIEKLLSMNILGAEPERIDSQAEKLPAYCKPFVLLKDNDINTLRNLSFTGEGTGVHKVREQYIKQAHDIFQKNGISAEPSGAAGLALYMQRYDEGRINQGKKVLIVNTGKGI